MRYDEAGHMPSIPADFELYFLSGQGDEPHMQMPAYLPPKMATNKHFLALDDDSRAPRRRDETFSPQNGTEHHHDNSAPAPNGLSPNKVRH